MKFLKQTSGPPLSSPRRVALLIASTLFWIFNILLVYNHTIAIDRLPDIAPRSVPDGIVYQTTDYSCGPASLATLFRKYNIIKSEREWAELAGTSLTSGTRLPGLLQAGESVGFEPVELNPSFEQLDLIIYPAILFQSTEYHLVTYWGIDYDSRIIIRDPILGCITWGESNYAFYTPQEPILLVFYPGTVPTCDSETASIEIARFQNILKSIGYYHGMVDGDWSTDLASAIRNFQEEMNLEAIGEIDAPTSLYLEGAWRLVTQGPVGPLMSIDRSVGPSQRLAPITTTFSTVK